MAQISTNKNSIGLSKLVVPLEQLSKSFPNNYYFALIFWIFKFLGILIITHSGINQNTSTLATYFRKITFIQSSSVSLVLNYNILCFIIYAILTILTTSTIIFIYSSKSKNNTDNSKKGKVKKSKIFRQFLSFCISIIALFSQHIIEVLNLIYYNLYVNGAYITNNSSNKDTNVINTLNFFTSFQTSLLIDSNILLIINTIFILLTNFVFYNYLKYSNSIFIFSDSSMKFPANRMFRIFIMIITNFSGVHYIDLFFPSVSIKIVLLIFSFIILIILFFSFEKHIFINSSNLIILNMICYCLISTLLGFVIYLTSNDLGNKNDSNSIILCLVIEVVLALIICMWYLNYKKSKNIKNISDNFFKTNKSINISAIKQLLEILKYSITSSNDLNTIFDILNSHKLKCKEELCNCSNYKVEEFYTGMKVIYNSGDIRSQSKRKIFKENFYKLLIMIENEILKTLHSKHHKNSDSFSEIKNLFFLHIEFVMYFKGNTQFSLFLKNQYTHYTEVNFLNNLIFYKLEKEIIKSEKYNFSHFISSDSVSEFKEFYQYQLFIKSVRELINNNLNKYEKLLKIKRNYSEEMSRKYFFRDNTRDIIKSSVDLYEGSNKLTDVIIKEFSLNFCQNAELSFLLYNYYMLVNHKIPAEVDIHFLHINSYSDLMSLETSYEERNMKHPVILKLPRKSFTISYISQKLCDYLGYRHSDLIDKDFHLLLPQFIREQHSIIMKKFILFENKYTFTKETFIVDKFKNIFFVDIKAAVIPGLNENSLIMDITPKEKKNSDTILILDYEYNLVTLSSNFEDKFLLNYEMLDTMEVSIFSLFGISEIVVQKLFKEGLNEIEKTNLDHVENMLTVLKPVNLKTLLDLKLSKTESKLTSFDLKYNKSIIVSKKKVNMLNCIQKLQTVVMENEFPQEWRRRLSELERLLDTSYIKPKHSFTTEKYQKKISLIDNIKLEIQLRSVGSQPYFLIKLIEGEAVKPISSNTDLSKRIKFSVADFQNVKGTTILKSEANVLSLFTDNVNKTVTQGNLGLNESIKDTSMAQLFHRYRDDKNSLGFGKKSTKSLFGFEGISAKSNIRKYRLNITKRIASFKFNKDQITYFFLFILLISLTFFSIYDVFFSSNIITTANNIFKINYNAMQVGSLSTYGGLTVLSSCVRAGQLNTLKSNIDGDSFMTDLRGKFRTRALELNTYVYNIKVLTSNLKHVDSISEIENILDSKEEYSVLSDNWQPYARNSTFSDELDYYHYYLANLQNTKQWTNCAIGKNGVVGSSNITPSFGEKTTHYFINNVITKFRKKLSDIFLFSSSILLNYHNSSKLELLLFNIIILIIFVLLAVTILFSILNFNNKIRLILIDFLKEQKQNEIFEKRLNNFRSVLLCLDLNVGLTYDENINTINKMTENNKLKLSTSLAVDNVFKKILKETKDVKTVNFSDLKSSSKEDTPTEKQSEMEFPIFTMKLVKYSVFLILIFIVFYFVLIVFIISSNYQDFDTLLFANQVSSNFINRYPIFAELVLYYKLSLLLNNPNYVTVSQNDYTTLNDFYDVFQKKKIPSDDSFYSTLKDSFYAYNFYTLQNDISNIKTFMTGNYNILPNLIKLENLFNSPSDVCFQLGWNDAKYLYNKNYNMNLGFVSVFNYMSASAIECRTLNNGINSNGLSLPMDNYLAHLKSVYYDYFVSNRVNINDFLSDAGYLQAQQSAEYTFKKAHNGLVNVITSDMTLAYSKFNQKEYIFSSLKVIISFFFMIYFVFAVLWRLKTFNFYLKKGIEIYNITQNDQVSF